jgi:hypothetical protein
MALASLLLLSARNADVGLLDRLIPVTVLAAVFVGRILQTRAEASRMLSQGFTTDAVMLGLRQLGEEREGRRAQLRADPGTVKRRRTTVRVAIFMLLVSVVLFRQALNMRTGVPGNYQTPVPGVVMLFSALPCFGMGLVLLLRSPLRMSLLERVFRWIWLGRVGRRFVQSVAPKSGTTVPSIRVAPAIAAASSKALVHAMTAPPAEAETLPSGARLEALEARLARLERQLDSK